MSENKKREYLSTRDIGYLLDIYPVQARFKAENGELNGIHTKNGWTFPVSDWEDHPKFQDLLKHKEEQRIKSIQLAKAALELLELQKEEQEKMETDFDTVHTYEIEQFVPYRLNPILRNYFEGRDTEEKLLLMAVFFLVMQNQLSLEEASKLTNTPIEEMQEYIKNYNIRIE